jgi:cystathionine beta-lyase/cystathionine gamma-synthase
MIGGSLVRLSHSRGLEVSEEPFENGFSFGGIISVCLSTPPCLFTDSVATVESTTAKAFLTSIRLFTLAAPLGGVESLVEHPGAMTD